MVSTHSDRPWLGMSTRSTRWSRASCLPIWVQLRPCPKSPWQNATVEPVSPSSVT